MVLGLLRRIALHDSPDNCLHDASHRDDAKERGGGFGIGARCCAVVYLQHDLRALSFVVGRRGQIL